MRLPSSAPGYDLVGYSVSMRALIRSVLFLHVEIGPCAGGRLLVAAIVHPWVSVSAGAVIPLFREVISS